MRPRTPCRSPSCCSGREAGDFPIGLRQAYHRNFGYHTRLNIAVVVTLLVIAYVVVPQVDRLVDSLGGYTSRTYEPKDLARQHWLETRGRLIGVRSAQGEITVYVILFLLVAVVWLAIVPPGSSRR